MRDRADTVNTAIETWLDQKGPVRTRAPSPLPTSIRRRVANKFRRCERLELPTTHLSSRFPRDAAENSRG